MIYLTGDTHGDFFRLRSPHRFLKPGDNVVILGDFGGVWNMGDGGTQENKALNHLDSLPYSIQFIDGNHENFPRLMQYPLYGDYEWGRSIRDNVTWLRRGYVHDWEVGKVFVFGGARSHDKEHRIIDKSWWAAEEASMDEFELALDNLEAVNYEVDYVLTHTAPAFVINQLETTGYHDSHGGFFDHLIRDRNLSFKKWYFGHLHKNVTIGKFRGLYEEIIPLGA